jgi:hypothetical protein
VSADVLVDGHRAVPDVSCLAGHDEAGDDPGALVVHFEDRVANIGEWRPSGLEEVAYWPGPAGCGGEVGELAGSGEQVEQVTCA